MGAIVSRKAEEGDVEFPKRKRDKEGQQSYEKKGSRTLMERRDKDMDKVLWGDTTAEKQYSSHACGQLFSPEIEKQQINFSKGFEASGLTCIIISLLKCQV